MKRKSASSAANGCRHLAALESNYLAQLLPIVEHMGVTQYDDGEPRLPGFVTIRTQGAAWCIDVKDPDSGMSFRIVDQVLDKALESVALLLACEDCPWTPDPYLKGKNKRTGKK